MVDRPIIFSGSMVKALLDGRKTMTRRLASSPLAKRKPGDRFYVREKWAHDAPSLDDLRRSVESDTGIGYGPYYRADARDFDQQSLKWHPAIYMPRFASRLTLLVNEVRFERLQDISEADALAEGITAETVVVNAHCAGGVHTEETETRYFYEDCPEEGFEHASDAYADLWDRLHGAGSWDENPELVARLVRVAAFGTQEMIAAAHLHDVVEDTGVTIEDIAVVFPAQVVSLVDWMTDKTTLADGNRATRKAFERERWGKAPIEAQTIKLADAIDNARDITAHDRGFAKVYLAEMRLLLPNLRYGSARLQSILVEILHNEEAA